MTFFRAVYNYIPGSVIAVLPIGTIVRHAQPSDVVAIDSLRKADGDSLGMIPIQVYQSIAGKQRIGRDRWTHQHLLIAEDNGDVAGFCYASYFQPEYTEIV